MQEVISQKKEKSLEYEQRRKEFDKECTFRPFLNSKSEKLARQKEMIYKDSNVKHYELLFQDAQRRRMRLEENMSKVPKEFVFSFKISQNIH